MSGSRIRFRAAIVAGLALVACSGGDPGADAVAEGLRGCPRGDAAWRELLDHEDVQEDAEALRERLASLETGCPGRWEPPWALAESLMREDLNDEAAPHLERAVELAQASGDPEGVALGSNGLGWRAYAAGDYDESERLYLQALEAAVAAERIDLASYVHNNLAGVFKDRGEFARARESLEAAERGLTELGRADVALALAHNRAVMLLELGNAAAASRLLEANHARAAEAGDAWLRDAAASVLGQLNLAREDPGAARAWFDRVEADEGRLRRRADLGIAMTALEARQYGDAVEGFEALLAGGIDDDRHLVATTELMLARAWIEAGQGGKAEALLKPLREAGDAVDAEDAGWASRWLLARVRTERGEAGSEALLREAIDLIEAQSQALDPLGGGLYFLRGRIEPYVDLAVHLARQGKDEEVWHLAGRLRARALRTSTGAAVSPEAVGLDAMRSALRPGELLLAYMVGDQGGVVVAVTPAGVRVETLAPRAAYVPHLMRYLQRLDPERPPTSDPGVNGPVLVRNQLLGPVEDLVAAAKTLYVIPDRELALLPFAALPAADGSGAFLGQTHDVAVLPFPGLPPRGGQAAGDVLLAGGPTFGEGSEFRELPWAGFELSGLGRIWEGARRVDGDAFTRDGLDVLASERLGVVHLATHAVASTRDPRECGVVLSGGDRIGIDEIVALDLDDSLVVLSACRTGEGELVPGEGVIGLGWAFLRAGARAIVVSRWSVDDVAAARLMIEFHTHLRAGEDPVRALGLARRARAAEDSDPALWAQFDVILRP
jgi:tetratricopeptide (TPR) repeat protein